jgi:hypothetical protein
MNRTRDKLTTIALAVCAVSIMMVVLGHPFWSN